MSARFSPGTVSEAFPVAEKRHRCDACGEPILPGERYRRWTGRSDYWTGLATEKRCASCCATHNGLDLEQLDAAGQPLPVVIDGQEALDVA